MTSINQYHSGGGHNIVKNEYAINILVASADYQELDEQVTTLQKHLKLIPEKDIVERRTITKKLQEKTYLLEQLRDNVLRLAETLSKINIDTERLKIAKQYFEKGHFKEADEILSAADLKNEQDRLREEHARLLEKKEIVQEQLRQNANEWLVKADMSFLQKDVSFLQTEEYYKNSIISYPNYENHYALAVFYQRFERLDDAIFHFTSCEKYIEENVIDQCQVVNMIGMCFLDKFDTDEAISYLKKALKMTRKASLSKLFEANIYSNLGNVYVARGEDAKALNYYKKAVRFRNNLAKEQSPLDFWNQSITLSNAAAIHERKGDLESSLSCYNQCIEIRKHFATEIDDDTTMSIAESYRMKGKIEAKLHSFQEAFSTFKECFRIIRPLYKDKPWTYQYFADSLNDFAIFCQEKGWPKYQKHFLKNASNVFELNYNSYKSPKARINYAITLYNLANSYLSFGEKEQALACLDKAVELYTDQLVEKIDVNRLTFWSKIFYQREALLFEDGNYNAALENLRCELKLRNQVFALTETLDIDIVKCLQEIALCYDRLNNLEKSKYYLEKAKVLYEHKLRGDYKKEINFISSQLSLIESSPSYL